MLHVKIGDTILGPDKEISKDEAQAKIQVLWDNSNPDKLYSLIMYDPDAPGGNFTHWLVVNIQGNRLVTGNTLLDYYAPQPPTGAHRYIIKIVEQRTRLALTKPESRQDFPSDVMESGRIFAQNMFRVRSV